MLPLSAHQVDDATNGYGLSVVPPPRSADSKRAPPTGPEPTRQSHLSRFIARTLSAIVVRHSSNMHSNT